MRSIDCLSFLIIFSSASCDYVVINQGSFFNAVETDYQEAWLGGVGFNGVADEQVNINSDFISNKPIEFMGMVLNVVNADSVTINIKDGEITVFTQVRITEIFLDRMIYHIYSCMSRP